MKIEIGESLLCTWLKHVKKCQVVQLNWQVSSEWAFENMDIVKRLMVESNALFA